MDSRSRIAGDLHVQLLRDLRFERDRLTDLDGYFVSCPQHDLIAARGIHDTTEASDDESRSCQQVSVTKHVG